MSPQPPIFTFNQSKDDIVEEVVARACDAMPDPRLALSEAAFLEVKRQQSAGTDDVVPLGEWRLLARSLARMSDTDCIWRLREIVTRYARDVAGNFDPRVYKFASRTIAPLIGLLMSPMQTMRHLGSAFDLRALDGRVVVHGPIGAIRSLTEKGTVIYVPTHLSNLDSVVFGFALERVGLSPATYGAGKNLFTNPALSFFMHNLGAYRIDRRLKHGMYKEVLKAYSCVILERGYHSLFFPGGTRSRSGAVERKLKLGLAGTGVEAMARTAARGQMRKVFFVPATINYLLTLEAETLIGDFLQEEGKHRYIIEDDESAKPGRIAAFMRKLLGLDAGCVVRFSQPLDCFGNRVDEEGISYDARGHAVSPLSYLTDGEGRVCHDPARDAQYTRELSESIVDAYSRDTVALATHLVASAAFEKLRESVMGPSRSSRGVEAAADIFAMLRDQGRRDGLARRARRERRAAARSREGARVARPHRAGGAARAGERARHPRRGPAGLQRLSHDARARAAWRESRPRGHAPHLLLPEPTREPGSGRRISSRRVARVRRARHVVADPLSAPSTPSRVDRKCGTVCARLSRPLTMSTPDTPSQDPTPDASDAASSAPNESSASGDSPGNGQTVAATPAAPPHASEEPSAEGSPSGEPQGDAPGDAEAHDEGATGEEAGATGDAGAQPTGEKKRRRRRRRKKGDKGEAAGAEGATPGAEAATTEGEGAKPAERPEKREPRREKKSGPPRERPPVNAGDIVFGKIIEITDDAILIDIPGKARAIFDRREMLITDDDESHAPEAPAEPPPAETPEAPVEAPSGDSIAEAPVVASEETATAVPTAMPAEAQAEAAPEAPSEAPAETVATHEPTPEPAAEPTPEPTRDPKVPRVILEVGADFIGVVHNDGARGGLVVLTHHPKRLEKAKALAEKASLEKTTVLGLVTGVIKGGIEVDVDGLRAFAPGSHVDLRLGADLSHLVAKRLPFFVTQYAKRGRDVVLSRRSMLEDESRKARSEALSKLKVGEEIEGIVRSVVPFGAFVDVGGIEGLVPLQEMSHNRGDGPSDVFKAGEPTRVVVMKIDDKGKIWLSHKATIPDPWHQVSKKYATGTRHSGKVVRLQPFGAFIELEPGVDGLLHTQDLSVKRIETPEEVVKVGDEIEVTVAHVDPTNHKIALHPALQGDAANEAPQKVAPHKPVKAKIVAIEAGGLVVRLLGVTGRNARGIRHVGRHGDAPGYRAAQGVQGRPAHRREGHRDGPSPRRGEALDQGPQRGSGAQRVPAVPAAAQGRGQVHLRRPARKEGEPPALGARRGFATTPSARGFATTPSPSSGAGHSPRRRHPPHSAPRQMASKRAWAWSRSHSSSVSTPISKLRRPSPLAPRPAPVKFALPR